MSQLRLTALSHDLYAKRSVVAIVWSDDPDKSLALFVPFGCTIEDACEEALKAVRALSAELATIPVVQS